MSWIPPKPRWSYRWYLWPLMLFQRWKYGKELEPTLLWGRHPKLLRAFRRMVRYLFRKGSPIDAQLRGLITLKIAKRDQCRFCTDLNTALFLQVEGDVRKLDHLTDFETSVLFSDKEKVTLRYVDATLSPEQCVVEAHALELKEYYSDDDIVELTALITFQNMSARFNAALGAESAHLCQSQRE